MLFSVVLITAIILASSFGLHIMPIDSIYKLSTDVAANALYVCPVADNTWDSISHALRPGVFYINMFFFFALMLLVFSWGWALYQNLLKDSFKQDAFKNVWGFTKMLFWSAVIITILVLTPNHYKSVHVQGAKGEWILCESNSPGAIPVRANAVKR
ncbi:MAG: hypothetical protein JW985_02650 [Alphaproteobacteria bacterium]|nr:hypothetical protein [Alphaproteobacteria bacterium]HOY47593.1 hypothetical protein [Alphaproteobacteria bacterium]